jgi:tetratricopeptide (TPR) repeat protein
VRARHFLSIIYLYTGDLARMLQENDQVVAAAQRMRDMLLLYRAHGFRSWAQARLGQHEEAVQSMEHAEAAAEGAGGHLMGEDIFGALNAGLLLAAGRAEEALAGAEATVVLAREEVGGLLGEGLAERVRGQALAHLERWVEAEAHLAASVRVLLAGECRLEAARTQLVWGQCCRDRGDEEAAQQHFEQAAAQFEASGLERELDHARQYLVEVAQR